MKVQLSNTALKGGASKGSFQKSGAPNMDAK